MNMKPQPSLPAKTFYVCCLIAVGVCGSAAGQSEQPSYTWPYPASVTPPTRVSSSGVCHGQGYPPEALAAGAEATVSLIVGKNGSVRDLKLVQSSGSDAVDKSSIARIQRFHYRPAMQNGEPVEVVLKVRQTWEPLHNR